ncbi:UNVERIFIED_CONTAM: hypothetical protein PO582_06695 [Atlantibacter hermannii]|uniref:hypothetical protein n=1 Tax=Atlantibacter hermannii TaxID=565 RepID=UPI002FFB32DA
MSMRLLKSVKACHIGPGSVIEVFDEWYRVRKINYGRGTCTIYLQPESEPINPLVKNDVIVITVPEEINIDVGVLQ